MIGFLCGTVEEITEEGVVLNVGGVGYNVMISGKDADALPPYGEQVKLYTYLSVREDAMKLYGFLTRDELAFFKLLIGVNGIGPKGGQAILSSIGPDELRFAIMAGDSRTLSKCPGIGAKTAQRIILDLKDKVDIEDVLNAGNRAAAHTGPLSADAAGVRSEAVEALTALGYSASDALRAVKSVPDGESMDVERLLSASLKYISAF